MFGLSKLYSKQWKRSQPDYFKRDLYSRLSYNFDLRLAKIPNYLKKILKILYPNFQLNIVTNNLPITKTSTRVYYNRYCYLISLTVKNSMAYINETNFNSDILYICNTVKSGNS